MRQRIEPAQLNELSPEQKEALREWWKPQKSDIAVVVNPETELYERFRGIELVVDDMIDCKYNRIDFYASPSHYSTPTLYRGVPMFHKQDCLPLLSIGQMIEIIYDKTGDINIESHIGGSSVVSSEGIYDKCQYCGAKVFTADPENICSALWEAVKEVL